MKSNAANRKPRESSSMATPELTEHGVSITEYEIE